MPSQRKKLKRILLPIALFASFSVWPPGDETRISFLLLVVVNNCMLSYLGMIRKSASEYMKHIKTSSPSTSILRTDNLASS